MIKMLLLMIFFFLSKIKPSIGDTIFVYLNLVFHSQVSSVCCINFSTSSISALMILIWASLELIIALRDRISDSKYCIEKLHSRIQT